MTAEEQRRLEWLRTLHNRSLVFYNDVVGQDLGLTDVSGVYEVDGSIQWLSHDNLARMDDSLIRLHDPVLNREVVTAVRHIRPVQEGT